MRGGRPIGKRYSPRPGKATEGSEIRSPVAGQAATVSVDLWGITRDAAPNEHHVRLLVNGVEKEHAELHDGDKVSLGGVTVIFKAAA